MLQVNLVTTVQESITAVAKVLEALDNESLVDQTAATSAAIASTSSAMQNAATQNAKLSSQLQVPCRLLHALLWGNVRRRRVVSTNSKSKCLTWAHGWSWHKTVEPGRPLLALGLLRTMAGDMLFVSPLSVAEQQRGGPLTAGGAAT